SCTSNSSTRRHATATSAAGRAPSTNLSVILRKEEIMAQTAVNQRTEKPAAEAIRSHGTFCWNELMTRDVERAKRFYASTIGWQSEAMPMPDGGTYWVATQNGKPVAGMFSLNAPGYDGVPESWMSYVAVDDVDARVAKAVKAGAKLMKPIFDIPNVGRIAILMEPGGTGVAWITPLPRR